MKKIDFKLWGAILLLIALVIYLILISSRAVENRQTQIDNLRQEIQQIQIIRPLNGIDGRDGLDGKDGISIVGERGQPGRDGRDGEDGKDGEQGEKGDVGEQGVPGREQELRCNKNIIETRYIGDVFWKKTNIKCESNE